MTTTTAANLADLIGAVPLDGKVKHQTLEMLRGADRFYHGVDHVALLWQRHRTHAREAGFDDPRHDCLMAGAILFHDCVYAADQGDSEERSAEAWLEASVACGIDAGDRAWVAETIRATRDHLGYASEVCRNGSPDRLQALRLWMLDLDLTPFGEAPHVFDQNARLLRAEASHLNDETFEKARLSLLRRFADTEIIYRTPSLAARFDKPARRNLARHLAVSKPTI